MFGLTTRLEVVSLEAVLKLELVVVASCRHPVFGAFVQLEKDDGSDVEYRIVGPDEADAASGCISIDSPLAKLLLKKSVGDECSLQIGDRTEAFAIVAVRYDAE